MELKKYSTEELRNELERRSEEEHKKREAEALDRRRAKCYVDYGIPKEIAKTLDEKVVDAILRDEVTSCKKYGLRWDDGSFPCDR